MGSVPIINHPCFNIDAAGSSARMHLPVAPLCNIQCNYCNRLFDCANESRPGVTSNVLSPVEALEKVKEVVKKIPRLTTVGIAGPGDALANPDLTFKTLSLIRNHYPHLNYCMATNGLNIPTYINDIVKCGVNFITVTINAIDTAIGSKIYKHVTFNGTVYKGEEASRILIKNQIEGIRLLLQKKIKVKINSVLIPGINDSHLKELANEMKEKGVSLINIIPMINVKGSAFENHPVPSQEFYKDFVASLENEVPLMKHCRLCRADEVGFLNDTNYNKRPGKRYSPEAIPGNDRVAVASRTGKLVDEHFGRAETFYIYELNESGFTFIEKRNVKKFCNGRKTCIEDEEDLNRILMMINDCSHIICSMAGGNAEFNLKRAGFTPIYFYGPIEEAILSIKKRDDLTASQPF